MAVTYETDVTGLETTQYYKLYKPGYDNVADINVLNMNAEIIDAILHDHESLMDDITSRTIDGVLLSRENDITHYGTCSTDAATAAKTVACKNFRLVTGSLIFVKFTVTNTAANATLNVNSTGAKVIQYRGSAISAGYLAANRTYGFMYDGSNYQLIGDLDTNTTYGNFVKSGSGAKAGLVPAPSTTAGTTKYLREDGTWQVPPDTNTDTHWTSHLYVGDGTAANKATTNGNTKIVNTDNSSVRNAVTIKGTGATTVTSDANGVITIHSTDNNTTYSNMTAATASEAGKAGLVPAPAAGNQGKFLRGDGTWQTPTNTTYSAGTTAQLTTGNDTANRVWPAKQIADYVKGTTSLAQNGYWKAPNGLIIQWGTYDTKSSGSSVTVSFPVSFPAACSVVNITEMDDSLSGAVVHSAAIGKDSITKQNFVASHDTAYKIHWIALGN